MPKHRLVCVTLTMAVLVAAPCRAGYDFEPPSLRSFMRFWGIGPGPGYHAVPCPLPARRHYRRATGNFRPMPVESDYYPDVTWPLGPIAAKAPDQPPPWTSSPAAEPIPAPQPLANPVTPPSTEVGEDPGGAAIEPSEAGSPPAPRPWTIDPAPSVPRQDQPVRPLIDALMQEQDTGAISRPAADVPPAAVVSPHHPRPSSGSASGDSWW